MLKAQTTETIYTKLLLAVLTGILLLFVNLIANIFFGKYTCIHIDGKELKLKSCLGSKEAIVIALSETGHVLAPADIILPPTSFFYSPETTTRIIRVTEKIVTQLGKPTYEVLWHKKNFDNLRAYDLQKVKVSTSKQEIQFIYHDGLEKERKVLRERITSKTIFRLLLFKKDSSLDKAYDLSKCQQLKMIATAYYPGDPLAWRDGTITYLGEKMERGIVAVDPKVIPLRTRVYVPGYGYGYAGDTGSAIKGKRIDLGVNNVEEEKEFMHKRVVVYILEKAKDW